MTEETCTQGFYVGEYSPFGAGSAIEGVRVQLIDFDRECYSGEDGHCHIAGLPYFKETELIATKEGYKKSGGKIITCKESIIDVPMQEDLGGPCFIATAAYGTPLHEDIKILREFRDKHLLTNPFGRIFTRVYYTLSPPFANMISKSELLRVAVRKLLIAPVVRYLRRKRE